MVGLHGTGLYDVGIDGALGQEADALQLAGLLFKDADELGADYLALLLGVGHTGQFVEEAVNGIDIHQIGVHLVAEDAHHLLGLALAQQTVIDVYRHQLFAHGLDKQGGHHGGIDTARQGQQHFLVAYLFSQFDYLFFNEFLGQSGGSDALHVGRTDVTCSHKR